MIFRLEILVAIPLDTIVQNDSIVLDMIPTGSHPFVLSLCFPIESWPFFEGVPKGDEQHESVLFTPFLLLSTSQQSVSSSFIVTVYFPALVFHAYRDGREYIMIMVHLPKRGTGIERNIEICFHVPGHRKGKRVSWRSFPLPCSTLLSTCLFSTDLNMYMLFLSR
jgi:hypothetical protein